MRPIEAQYQGWCSICSRTIEPGDWIIRTDTDGWVHSGCEAWSAQPIRQVVPVPDLTVSPQDLWVEPPPARCYILDPADDWMLEIRTYQPKDPVSLGRWMVDQYKDVNQITRTGRFGSQVSNRPKA